MIKRTTIISTLIACLAFVLVAVLNTTALADEAIRTNVAPAPVPERISGKVIEFKTDAGYTYVQVETGTEKVWAAGPVTELKNGDTVTFTTDMPMHDFHSKALNRDFPVLYFSSSLKEGQNLAGIKKAHSGMANGVGNKAGQSIAHVEGIERIDGGNTIDEIMKDKDSLGGKMLRVRGKVTKVNARIMKRNWIHLRDSSSPDDLIVTSNALAVVGDVVVVKGKLGLNRDFGLGYTYPVLLEDATITKE
jgi:hypothetical protein